MMRRSGDQRMLRAATSSDDASRVRGPRHMSRLRAIRVAVVLVIAGAACTASSAGIASAADTWSAPVVIGDSPGAAPLGLTVTSAGAASAYFFTQPASVAVRPGPQAAWLPQAPLSPFNPFFTTFAADPQGDLVVGYIDGPDTCVVHVAVNLMGIGWEPPTTFTDTCNDPGFTAGPPVLAIRRDGVVVAAWGEQQGGGDAHARVAQRRSDGTWLPPVLLDNGGYARITPRAVALGGGGAALVVVDRGVLAGSAFREGLVRLSRGLVRGSVDAGPDTGFAGFATSPNGRFLLAVTRWTNRFGFFNPHGTEVFTGTVRGGLLDDARSFPQMPYQVFGPQAVAINDAGDGVLAWSEWSTGSAQVVAARRTPDGTWSRPLEVSAEPGSQFEARCHHRSRRNRQRGLRRVRAG